MSFTRHQHCSFMVRSCADSGTKCMAQYVSACDRILWLHFSTRSLLTLTDLFAVNLWTQMFYFDSRFSVLTAHLTSLWPQWHTLSWFIVCCCKPSAGQTLRVTFLFKPLSASPAHASCLRFSFLLSSPAQLGCGTCGWTNSPPLISRPPQVTEAQSALSARLASVKPLHLSLK